MRATRPSVDYLAKCSKSALESLELSRLNVAANLRKQAHQILSELIDQEVDARLARAILDWRRGQEFSTSDSAVPLLACQEPGAASCLPTPEQLSIAFEAADTKRAECDQMQNFERDASNIEAAATGVALSEIQQMHQPYPSQTPMLARAAAASGATVESLGDGRRCPTHADPRCPQRKTVKRIPIPAALADISNPAALANDAIGRRLGQRSNADMCLGSPHFARPLVCSTVAVARSFA